MDEKYCSQCRETKSVAEFHRDRGQKDGLQRRCKICARKHAAIWWSRHGKESYQKHKDYQREWKAKNPERYAARQRRYHLKRKYAMTEMEYQQRILDQNGKCACCGAGEMELVIDHDHASGSVRSLLCQPCNKGLGCFFDDPAKLRLAAEYLEKHNEPKD